MTPEEAIEIIEKQIITCEAMIEFNENFDPEEDNTKFLKEKEAEAWNRRAENECST